MKEMIGAEGAEQRRESLRPWKVVARTICDGGDMTGQLTVYTPDGKAIEVGTVWKFEPFDDGSIAYKTAKDAPHPTYTNLAYIFHQQE